MKTSTNRMNRWNRTVIFGVLALAGIVLVPGGARTVSGASTSGKATQTTFQSPEQAATALEQAAERSDPNALSTILGDEIKARILTGDRDSDKAAMVEFVAKYKQMNRWLEMSDGSRILYIGADNFAFPVPLAENSAGQWYFDGVAGAQEIRAREIGRNELLAIDACYSLANAEELYFELGGDSPVYAQRIISADGKRDGLFWPVSVSEDPSPLGRLDQVPEPTRASLSADQLLTIDGYSFRILNAQGYDAPGGAQSYLVNGRMVRGFAILATPVKYAETGIMTFVISRDGIVYEQNLGPDTAKIAAGIHQYNPDDDWNRAD